jgi:hypothetical protein
VQKEALSVGIGTAQEHVQGMVEVFLELFFGEESTQKTL